MTMFRMYTGVGLAVALVGGLPVGSAHATADGPDHYRIRNAPEGKPLALRAEPGQPRSVGVVPTDATCLRNLGCQGGLSLQEFTSLTAEQQQARLAANPRWCKLEYRTPAGDAQTGWLEGQFLAEDGCANPPAQPTVLVASAKSVRVKGTVKGNATAIYDIKLVAGQTMSVVLAAKHPQTYVNVTPMGNQEAMFIGSSSGNTMQRRVATDGDYRIEVYLMRAAARRAASSAFTLNVGVSGKAMTAVPATADARVAGTPFHATATVPCTAPYDPSVTQCTAGVIRRGMGGTATVQVRLPQGVRNVLFAKGALVASDAAQPVKTTRTGETTRVQVGPTESFEIPDALLTGG